MAFLQKFPKNPTREDVMKELSTFLAGSQEQAIIKSAKAAAAAQQNSAARSHSSRNQYHQPLNPVNIPTATIPLRDTIHSGIFLLRHLPVARDAVFEFISGTYNSFVQNYVARIEGANVSISDDDIKLLDEIHTSFVSYLDDGGEIWAPILSQWTLQLLGQLSREYSNRPAFASHLQSVNELIHIWMGSKAVQSLNDLTSRCLTCVDQASTDHFISALLDTSAIHSPHFDWVVAHVGNTYPQTVVNEVLNLGLQNFSGTSPEASKLKSVVGILGHLATTHFKEVQLAFDNMIQDGISSGIAVKEQFSIPFLLQLCSTSVPLLDALMDTALPKLKEATLQKLRILVPQWIPLHFGGHETAIVALVTHLILKSTRGPKALEILMTGCKTWPQPLGHNARILLDHFVAEISALLYEADHSSKDFVKNFPCISSLLDKHSNSIIRFLIDADSHVCRTAKQFVKLLSFYNGPGVGIKAICYYFREAKSDKHLWHMVDLIRALEMKHSTILSDSIHLLLVKCETTDSPIKAKNNTSTAASNDPLRMWKNILRLVKTETIIKNTPRLRQSVSSVLQGSVLSHLLKFLDPKQISFSMEEATLVVDIISRVIHNTNKIQFDCLLVLDHFLVDFLFRVLSTTKANNGLGDKLRNTSHISKLLNKLSTNPAIRNDALRNLVQSCLNPDYRKLFLSRVSLPKKVANEADSLYVADDEFIPQKLSMYVSLMKENRKKSAGIGSLREHSTRFHSGKLLKRDANRNWEVMISQKMEVKENPDAQLNLQLFLGVMLNVCMTNTNLTDSDNKNRTEEVSVEAMRKVALLLVEIISPDVMFNGLPWPDEEFSKLQVERDLQIRRTFEEHPYLWDILEVVANYSPSLCYCSVLLRALMATLMAHWASCHESKTKNSPHQLDFTIRLLNLMKTGQLLPPPLSHIGEVVPHLKSNEVLLLLKDIWSYMRMNPPVPTSFVKDPTTKKYIRNSGFLKIDSTYTERLRLTTLNNVETIGFMYPKLFQGNDATSNAS